MDRFTAVSVVSGITTDLLRTGYEFQFANEQSGLMRFSTANEDAINYIKVRLYDKGFTNRDMSLIRMGNEISLYITIKEE